MIPKWDELMVALASDEMPSFQASPGTLFSEQIRLQWHQIDLGARPSD